MKTTETVMIADFHTEISEGPPRCEAGVQYQDVLFLCLLCSADVLHEPRVFPELCNFSCLAHSRCKRHFHLLSRNPLKTKRKLFNLKDPVRTAQSSLAIQVIKTHRRMLYRAKVASCPHISTKQMNTVRAECHCLNGKRVDASRKQQALEGLIVQLFFVQMK